MILLDTDVAIDILRNHAPALSWLQGVGAARRGQFFTSHNLSTHSACFLDHFAWPFNITLKLHGEIISALAPFDCLDA